jgi:L-aminopeptidase/D-esterase-like protein
MLERLRAGQIARLVICGSVCACTALGQAPPASPDGQTRSRGITDVPGIRVGQFTLAERPTGCTVILADGDGAVAGVSQRGGAPGTREMGLLSSANTIERVHGVVLSGGSAFGLDAAQGVVRYLEEHGTGLRFGGVTIPIVPAAIIFDLRFGNRPEIRPTADCGYRAAAAATGDPVREGNVGAGAGATVGKLGGPGRSAMKGGVGSASIRMSDGLVVGAIVVVNAVGDVIDPESGRVVAGTRNADGTLADVRKLIRGGAAVAGPGAGESTTIGVVATNARLTKAQMERMAIMADDGLARAIVPSHTPNDGDTIFALGTGQWDGPVDLTRIGALAADVLSEAIVRAVAKADSLGGFASARQTGSVPARLRLP